MVIGSVIAILFIGFAIYSFYLSLENEIYVERAAYLKEISEQVVLTTDTISDSQWNLAEIFANRMQKSQLTSYHEFIDFIDQQQTIFNQQGLSLLAFDDKSHYYDSQGNKVRWSGMGAIINDTSDKRQVEITTLPTTTQMTDEMVFILKMDQPIKINNQIILTHVAVTRDMSVFNKTFQIPSFEGEGENYIVSAKGTRVYRGQTPSDIIGDVYNIIKPLEDMKFLYGGSYQTLKDSLEQSKTCSLEFVDTNGQHYYVTASPMKTNNWTLLSVVPSEKVSEKMQQFMNKALYGMSAIALIVTISSTLAMFLIVRYRAGQRLIHEQMKANEDMRIATQAAQEANLAKTVFLRHMSHDIRTPINGIMGMTDIALRNINDSQRLKDCLQKIDSASHHLLSLVNDVLDMSRIESGKVQLDNKPFAIDTLLDACYSIISGQVIEKKIHLHKDFSSMNVSYLNGDELHIRQILINVLGNAVKFTPVGGRIDFVASSYLRENYLAYVTISIKDTGIGMSEQFIEHIFEPFAQEEDGSRSHYQGTGLGMAIVKQLLDLMGGDIQVTSSLGQGTEFIIKLCLPMEKHLNAPKQLDNLTADLSSLRVLLVEDNELNMEIAQYVLQDCGVEVITAMNGQEAVDIYTSADNYYLDGIFMDIMMPIMDGFEATQIIRSSHKRDCQSIPIVAMTANAYQEDRQKAIDAGMNDHLTKPIEREKIISALQKMYQLKQAREDYHESEKIS